MAALENLFRLKKTADLKIGIALKTYCTAETKSERYEIIETCLNSLANNLDCKLSQNISVLLVVDGKTPQKHQNIIQKYKHKFSILQLKENKGIAFSTNIGMKYLLEEKQIDIGFVCDDDVIFQKGFLDHCCRCILETNLHHINYYPEYLNSVKQVICLNNQNVCIQSGFAGCFYSFTPSLINSIGYLPILPEKYGFEHVVFSERYKKFFAHIKFGNQFSFENKDEKYISLNPKSIENKSHPNLKCNCESVIEKYLDIEYIDFHIILDEEVQRYVC